MEPSSQILEVKDLCIAFGGVQPFTAVHHISFSVDKGKTLAVVGESGSGKSLTAFALMGLLPKQASVTGEVRINFQGRSFPLHSLGDPKQWQQLRGEAMGMIFQEPTSSLNPVMKIGQQIAEAISTHQDIGKHAAKLKAVEWLGKVQLPQPYKLYNRYPHQLSGGQKQRVMIAMAMCNHPALLIADEPTTALDVTVQNEIVGLMQQLQRETGTAMIFITHDLALAGEIADDVLVMYKGEVMEYGNANCVLKDPQHAYTKALIACRPSPEHKGTRLPVVADFLNTDSAIPSPVQASSLEHTPQSVQASSLEHTPQSVQASSLEPLLKVQDLRVWFTENTDWLGRPVDYFKAVDGVSFELNKGEVLGLVGESGCGKSTISRSLMGLLPVHEGQVMFNGEDLAKLPHKEWTRIRRQIQLIFQDPYASLNPRMTIGDMLMEPMQVHGIVPRTQLKREAKRLLDLVQLPADSMKRYPHQFSGGQRQRIGIARALALRPQLLICDESVSALDVSVQAQILNLLKDLQREFDLTYLFISHDLNVVHYISDRVMVMQAGHIVEQGEATRVLQQPENEYTRKLIEAMPGR